MTTELAPAKVRFSDQLGHANEAQPLPEPAGFRTRYRSEPGMIGHYPWTYADQGRRRIERPSCEYEDLFTADQVRAAVAAERERINTLLAAIRAHWIKANGEDSMSVSALDVIAGVIADGSYVERA